MYWVKFKAVNDDGQNIYLPGNMLECNPVPENKLRLKFGLREKTVAIFMASGLKAIPKSDYHNPISIGCSRGIIDELMIQEQLVYRITADGGSMNVGPVIGLILGEQRYYYHDKHMRGEYTDAMTRYENIGGLVMAFKVSSINWNDMTIYGLYYEHKSQSWKYGCFPFPAVIFRRAYQCRADILERLKELTNGRTFNSLRLDKWQMNEKLRPDEVFSQYLPDTARLDCTATFFKYLDKYGRVILKPAGLSRSRGICIIHKMNNGMTVIHDYRDAKKYSLMVKSRGELPGFLVEGRFFKQNYIIQTHLELACINGSPFDIRVVMQKSASEKWGCSGIECRIAAPKGLVTNIARGGRALDIYETARLAFGTAVDPVEFEKEVIEIAEKFCRVMDRMGEHFAEFGLDIAVDIYNHFWFIEANVRPAFKGFKLIDYDAYLRIACTPVEYAAAIAGFGEGSVKNNEDKV